MSLQCMTKYVFLKVIEYVDKLAEVGKFSSRDEVVMEYGNDVLEHLRVILFFIYFNYHYLSTIIHFQHEFCIFSPLAHTFGLILSIAFSLSTLHQNFLLERK